MLSRASQVSLARGDSRGRGSARRHVVEQPHGVPLHVRREVRVAHRHVDRGVAEEILDGLERHAAHDEVGRELTCDPTARQTAQRPWGKVVGRVRERVDVSPVMRKDSAGMNSDLSQTFEALQQLEQGEFQELGDELLAWAFFELRQLRPYGLTSGGKTRKGVPDSYVGPTPREATIAVEYTTQATNTVAKLESDYASVREKCPSAGRVFLCTNRAIPSKASHLLRAKASEERVTLEIIDGVRLATLLAGDRQDLRHRFMKLSIGAHTLPSLLARLSDNVASASRGRSSAADNGTFVPRFRLDVLCFERVRRAPFGTTLLLGDAGEGKSSWSIDYAKRFAVVQPTVWLHALDVNQASTDPFGEAVALAAYGTADVGRLPELALLLKREKQQLVLIIDGADECRDYKRLQRSLRAFRASTLGGLTHAVLCSRTEAARQLQDALSSFASDIGAEQSLLRIGPLRNDERDTLLTFLCASGVEKRAIETHLDPERLGNPLFIEMAFVLARAGTLDSGSDLVAEVSRHFIADICNRLHWDGRAPSFDQVERFFIGVAEHVADRNAAGIDDGSARALANDLASGENTIVSRALQTPLLTRTRSGITFGHSVFLEHFTELSLLAHPDRISAAVGSRHLAERVARRAPLVPETSAALLAVAKAHPHAACVLLQRGTSDPEVADIAFKAIDDLLKSRFPSDVRRGLRFLSSTPSERSRRRAGAWFNGLTEHERRTWVHDAAELFFTLEAPDAAHLAGFARPFWSSWFEPSIVRHIDKASSAFREALRRHAWAALPTADAATRERCVNALALLRDEQLLDHLSADLERGLLDLTAHHALVFLNTERAIRLYAKSISKTLAALDSGRTNGSNDDDQDRLWSTIVPHTTDLIMLSHDLLIRLVQELLASSNVLEVAIGVEWSTLLREGPLFASCAGAIRRFPNTMMSVTTDLGKLLASASVSDIRSMFDASDPAMRRTLVHSIGTVPRPGLDSFLLERLAEPEHRLSAIQSLRRLGAISTAPQIAPFLNDPDPHVRQMAARTLGILRYVPCATTLATMLVTAQEGDDEYILVRALGSLGTSAAVEALEHHYPRTRRPADVLAALLRLGLESGIAAAERLTGEPGSWPLLVSALSEIGGRIHFGDALDGSGIPRQPHEPPLLLRSSTLLERVIHTTRERVQRPLSFMDDSLRAVAMFDMPDASVFLHEVAGRPALPVEAVHPDEKTFLTDPSLEAKRLLLERGDETYALDLLRMEFERVEKARYLHTHEITELAAYPRRLVRQLALESIEQGRSIARAVWILSHFLEPEDRSMLVELERSEDIAIADQAHQALGIL